MKLISTPHTLSRLVLLTGLTSTLHLQAQIDLGNDSLSDLWQLNYNAQELAPNADDDGDGRINRDEAIAGTDPLSSQSFISLQTTENAQGQLILQWQAVMGKSYLPQASSDLITWLPLGDSLIGNGEVEEVIVPPSSADRFFRVSVQDIDTDGDGLNDYEEHLIGFDASDQNTANEANGGDLIAAVSLLTGNTPFQVGSTMQTGTMPTAEAAARFLAMTTFGATRSEITQLQSMGYRAWIDDQMTKTPGLIEPELRERIENGDNRVFLNAKRHSWWRQIMTSDDLLRQRIAYVFSQIWVTSDTNGTLQNQPQGMANYYDLLLNQAFGNMTDLLRGVTKHPTMGAYLTYLKNSKATNGSRPDENYAREVMQLFTIGLHELNEDGSRKKDSEGNDIPTYTNEDITEFARVFTGFSFGGPQNENSTNFQFARRDYNHPMRMYDDFHDTDEKQLLGNTVLPAFEDAPGRTGIDDIYEALDSLIDHPNTGPFLVRRFIQQLVTSNPSPAYIQRVSQVFADNGLGVRGDFAAVFKAILLDPEALSYPTDENLNSGKLQEPWIRYVRMVRTFQAKSVNDSFLLSEWGTEQQIGQLIMRSPSVFNFYLPDHQPAGELANADLFAPEFQILTSVTAISSQNHFSGTMLRGVIPNIRGDDQKFLDFTEELELADDPVALMDRIDLLLTYGAMSSETRTIIIDAINEIPAQDAQERVEMAVRLTVFSPDYAIFR